MTLLAFDAYTPIDIHLSDWTDLNKLTSSHFYPKRVHLKNLSSLKIVKKRTGVAVCVCVSEEDRSISEQVLLYFSHISYRAFFFTIFPLERFSRV